MFVPTNPHAEEIRARIMLRSFTEHEKAVALFGSIHTQVETPEPKTNGIRKGQSFIMRVFNAIKRNRNSEVANYPQLSITLTRSESHG